MASTDHKTVLLEGIESKSALELAHVARTLLVDVIAHVDEQPEQSLYQSGLVHIDNAITLLEFAIQYCHRQNESEGIGAKSIEELDDLEGRVRAFAIGVIDFAVSAKAL